MENFTEYESERETLERHKRWNLKSDEITQTKLREIRHRISLNIARSKHTPIVVDLLGHKITMNEALVLEKELSNIGWKPTFVMDDSDGFFVDYLTLETSKK